MDHELGVDARHLVDGVCKYVLEFLNYFHDLGSYITRDLLADPYCSSFVLIDTYLFIPVRWTKPFVTLGVLGHIVPHEGEGFFRLMVLSFSRSFFLFLVF